MSFSGSRDNSFVLKVLKDVAVPEFSPKSGERVVNVFCISQ